MTIGTNSIAELEARVIELLNHIEDMVDEAPETVRLWNRVTALYAHTPPPIEMEADARRYQWLRGRQPGSDYRIAGVIYSDGGNGVDAAIDAAIAAEAEVCGPVRPYSPEWGSHIPQLWTRVI